MYITCQTCNKIVYHTTPKINLRLSLGTKKRDKDFVNKVLQGHMLIGFVYKKEKEEEGKEQLQRKDSLTVKMAYDAAFF